jgi:hypothetical protein
MNANGGKDFSNGVDLESANPPFIDPNSTSVKMRTHGTHVAGLIQGGAISPEYRALLTRFSQLMMMKIVAFPRVGDPENFLITENAVNQAIRYAVDNESAVMNLSIESRGLNYSWDTLTTQFAPQVFVVAAGNGRMKDGGRVGINFSGPEKAPAPAGLGGELSGNVISVAAHDGDGNLAAFSNYGQKAITMAAPGCGILSFLPGANSEGEYSGTSQAAPLVTMIVALLSEYRVPRSEIKKRLIASVDYKTSLKLSLYSGGVLNVQKSLQVFDDVIEIKAGNESRIVPCKLGSADADNDSPAIALRPGNPADGYAPNADMYQLKHLLKLTPLGSFSNNGSQVRLVFEPSGGANSKLPFSTVEGKLESTIYCSSTADGKELNWPLSGLQDYVRHTLP